MTNLVTGGHPRSDSSNSFRASLLFAPTDRFRNTTVFDGFTGHGLGGGFTPVAVNPAVALPAPLVAAELAAFQAQRARSVYVVAEDRDYPSHVSNYGLTNSSVLEVGDLTIRNIANYRIVKSSDIQGSGLPRLLGVPALVIFNDRTSVHQVSEELQFLGKALDNRLEYQAGLYYFREHGSAVGGASTLSNARSNNGRAVTHASKSVF